MAFGIAKYWADRYKAWKNDMSRRVQPKLHALCPGCGKSSIRYRKIARGKKRMIMCMRKGCGYISQSWTVGGPVPTPKGV